MQSCILVGVTVCPHAAVFNVKGIDLGLALLISSAFKAINQFIYESASEYEEKN